MKTRTREGSGIVCFSGSVSDHSHCNSAPIRLPERERERERERDMNSSLRKLRGLASIHRDDPKERKGHQPSAHLDELAQASQDLQDMRNCYDSLLSAAAATANSAYEFSEALREMGTCLLEKTALNDHEESGRVLLMLGKAQFELQKLVDSYRLHVVQTITTPSESLLKELQIVEEMKRQCDDKRDLYKFMLAAQREKGRTRNSKGESFSSQQLQAAQEDYDEEATLFVFHLKSLKQGQSRSLLTQAARHHAAQLSFFRKGIKSLEVVEPHVEVIAEKQHIDYQFSGLEDNGTEDDDDDNPISYDDGELSFEYTQKDQGEDVDSSSRNSMEFDQVEHRNVPTSTGETAKENLDRSQVDFLFGRDLMAGSQSAPILAEKKFEPSEMIELIQPSLTRKFHTYVLPTPIGAKSSALTGSGKPVNADCLENKGGWPTQLWHSSPLEPNKFVKDIKDDELSSPATLPKVQSVLKESNINSGPIRLPPPLAEGMTLPQDSLGDAKKIKRQAFSGPLTSKVLSNRPTFSAMPPTSRPSASPKVSPSASPPLMPSPKVSELHELPRPPTVSEIHRRPSNFIGHSAPLVSRSQGPYATCKAPSIASHKASPLPTPPVTMARSFSIPSTGHRRQMPTAVDVSRNQNMSKDISLPCLSSISLTTIQPASAASELIAEATIAEKSV